jgi:hypothetical protein
VTVASISLARLSSSDYRQRVERKLFRDVQRLIKYQQSAPEQAAGHYDQMIQARFDVLGELSRRA